MGRVPRALVALFGGGLIALGLGGWFVADLIVGGDRLRQTGVCRSAVAGESYAFQVPRLGRFVEVVFDADGRRYAVTAGYSGRKMLTGQPLTVCSEPDDPAVFTFAEETPWVGESFGRWFRGHPAGVLLVCGGVVTMVAGFHTYVSGGRGPTSYRPRH